VISTCPRVPEPGQCQAVPPEPAAPGCAARLATGELGYHGQEGYRTRHYDANRGVPLPTHQRPCGDLFGGEQNHPEYAPAHPAGYETASTGLMMVGAREYDPEIGRFLQPDPQPTGPDLQWGQLNRWAYCANDPVNASDPSGEHPIVVFAALVLLAALTMGFVNWMSNGSFWAGFAGGAVTGALSLSMAGPLGLITGVAAGSLVNGVLSNNAADQIFWDMAVGLAFAFAGWWMAAGALGAFVRWLLGLDASLMSNCLRNFPLALDGRFH